MVGDSDELLNVSVVAKSRSSLAAQPLWMLNAISKFHQPNCDIKDTGAIQMQARAASLLS
jgi:hypothetical protein